ncbi:MAG: hypothetical protein H8E12_06215 [Rhodobacteraceae bacterium]|nr:hypothetical protein [Paracoccaceae bacterium]
MDTIQTIRREAASLKKSAVTLGNLCAGGVQALGMALKTLTVSSANTVMDKVTLLKAGLAARRFTNSLGTVLAHPQVKVSIAAIYSDMYKFYARYMNKLADELEKLQADDTLSADLTEFQNSAAEMKESITEIALIFQTIMEDVANEVKESDEMKSCAKDLEESILEYEKHGETEKCQN